MRPPEPADGLPCSAAAERNRAPILAVLGTLLAPSGRALEIASGTGQHAAHFAAALPGWHWQPTDRTEAQFGAIAAWAARAGARNVAPARRLDVLERRWPSDGAPFAQPFDLVYCANLLHISPPECTPALLCGAVRHLAPGGLLVIYGPWLVQCFTLSGTYKSQKKVCGKARFAANAGGLGKNCNAAASLFLASRRASRQGAICFVAWP
ncbi:MAG TPA: DUF938 domain-containing protein [Ottowia sp.]|uniref:DUF938 domain-containing protein n=1 Tax=Ottowia sp. TaxID=1898956 RepID=UPI002D179A18|nr:DUF938 domain-containing protein [Ottowia sp.]HMN20760.1 DUF938 domain-containing protein [Ottowia sp.]